MQATPDLPQLLTEKETADILRLKPETLTVWRCNKRYKLPYVRCGRAIRYKRSDVLAFLERQTNST